MLNHDTAAGGTNIPATTRAVGWRKAMLVAFAPIAALAFASSAEAAFIVAPNANSEVEAPVMSFSPLGNGGGTFTTQMIVSVSQLGALAAGDRITSLGFRLDTSQATRTTDADFTRFDIQIGSAMRPFASQSHLFDVNMGMDTIVARSGALTIAGNTVTGGAKNGNRFFDIDFVQNFTYAGGDLVITIRSAGTNFIGVDAIAPSASTIRTTGNGGDNAFFGTPNYNAPVIRLGTAAATVGAVPEPSTWTMMIGGFGLAGGILRRRNATMISA